MRVAVVAVVESKDGVAVFVEEFAGAQHIGRVGTALPAVQKHDDAFRLRVRRVEALQGDVWNGVEQHFAGGVEHGIVAPRAEFVAGKQSLHESVLEIKRRGESLIHSHLNTSYISYITLIKTPSQWFFMIK